MKMIPLSQGKFALVDDDDYEQLAQYKWYANKVGRNSRTYYAFRGIRLPNGKRTTIAMHRAIMKPGPGIEVDHKDKNGLNNQRSNLRLCSHLNNIRASRCRDKGSAGKVSKYRGVSLTPSGKWHSRIYVNKVFINLGNFEAEADAAMAYDAAAIRYFGEFATTNFSKRTA